MKLNRLKTTLARHLVSVPQSTKKAK